MSRGQAARGDPQVRGVAQFDQRQGYWAFRRWNAMEKANRSWCPLPRCSGSSAALSVTVGAGGGRRG